MTGTWQHLGISLMLIVALSFPEVSGKRVLSFQMPAVVMVVEAINCTKMVRNSPARSLCGNLWVEMNKRRKPPETENRARGRQRRGWWQACASDPNLFLSPNLSWMVPGFLCSLIITENTCLPHFQRQFYNQGLLWGITSGNFHS